MKNRVGKKQKRSRVFVLIAAMIFIMGAAFPSQAASVRISPNTVNQIRTYKPISKSGDPNVGAIIIEGCTKKSQIKKLKSSNPSIVKVTARDGYIDLKFGKKTGKVKITCTVKGKKLSTYYTVKKYTNPLSTFKIGNKSFVSKFNKTDVYTQKSGHKNKILKLKAKKGWKIQSVMVLNTAPGVKFYKVNKSSFSKKITLNAGVHSSGEIQVAMYNSKTKVSELVRFVKY